MTAGRWESFLFGPSQRPDEAGGSRAREVPREAGAAPTTTGRVGTARRPEPGKRDGQAYECRNQWWNPESGTSARTWRIWAHYPTATRAAHGKSVSTVALTMTAPRAARPVHFEPATKHPSVSLAKQVSLDQRWLRIATQGSNGSKLLLGKPTVGPSSKLVQRHPDHCEGMCQGLGETGL